MNMQKKLRVNGLSSWLISIVLVFLLVSCTPVEIPSDVVDAVDRHFTEHRIANDYLVYSTASSFGSTIWIEIYMLDYFPFDGQHLANIHCPHHSYKELWDTVGQFYLALNFITIDRSISKVGDCSKPG